MIRACKCSLSCINKYCIQLNQNVAMEYSYVWLGLGYDISMFPAETCNFDKGEKPMFKKKNNSKEFFCPWKC